MADHFHHHHENHQGTPVSPGILKKTSDSLHADGTPWSSMPPPSAVKLHSGGFSLSVGSPQADGQCMWRQEAQKWKDIALSDRRELNHKVARLEAEVMEANKKAQRMLSESREGHPPNAAELRLREENERLRQEAEKERSMRCEAEAQLSNGRSGGGGGGPTSPLFRSVDKLVKLTDGGAAPSPTEPAVKQEWGSGMGIRFMMRTQKDNWGGGSVGARMRLAQAAGLSEGRVVINEMRPGEVDVTVLPACEGSEEAAPLDAVAMLSRQATDPHSALNTASGSGLVLGVSVVGAYRVGWSDGNDDNLGDSVNGSLEQSPGGGRGEEGALRERVSELEAALEAEKSRAEALASKLETADEEGGERALVDLQMQMSSLRKERDEALANVEELKATSIEVADGQGGERALVDLQMQISILRKERDGALARVEKLKAENAGLMKRLLVRDGEMILRSEADAIIDQALHTSADQSLCRETELAMQLASIRQEKEEMARQVEEVEAQKETVRSSLADMVQQCEELAAEKAALAGERDAAVGEMKAAVAERQAAAAERDVAVKERDAAVKERDAAVKERDAAVGERGALAQSSDSQDKDATAVPPSSDPCQDKELVHSQSLSSKLSEVTRERDLLLKAVEERDQKLALVASPAGNSSGGNADVEAMTQELDALASKLSEANKAEIDLTEMLQAAQDKLVKFEEQIGSVEGLREALRVAEEKVQDKNSLVDALGGLTTTVHAVSSERDFAADELKVAEAGRRQGSLESSGAVNDLKEQLKTMEQDLVRVKREKKETYLAMMQELTSKMEELSDLKLKNKKLSQQLSGVQDQTENLTATELSLKAVRCDVEVLREQLDVAEYMLKMSEEENGRLKGTLIEWEEQGMTLQKSVDEAVKEKDALLAELGGIKAQLASSADGCEKSLEGPSGAPEAPKNEGMDACLTAREEPGGVKVAPTVSPNALKLRICKMGSKQNLKSDDGSVIDWEARASELESELHAQKAKEQVMADAKQSQVAKALPGEDQVVHRETLAPDIAAALRERDIAIHERRQMVTADADLRAKLASAISERDILRANLKSVAQDEGDTRRKSEEGRVAIEGALARVRVAEKLRCEYEKVADDSKRELEEAKRVLDARCEDWQREKAVIEGEKSNLLSRVGELERELAVMKEAGTRDTSLEVALDDSRDELAKVRGEVEAEMRKMHQRELEAKDDQMYKMKLDVSVVRSQMEKESVRMQQVMKHTTESLRKEIAELTTAWETSEAGLDDARCEIRKLHEASGGGTAQVDAHSPALALEVAKLKRELSQLKKSVSLQGADARPMSGDPLSLSDDQVKGLMDELSKARSEKEEIQNEVWRLKMSQRHTTQDSYMGMSKSADSAMAESCPKGEEEAIVELRETNERLVGELAESKRVRDDLELLVRQTQAQLQLLQENPPVSAPALDVSGDETDAEVRLKREVRDARERINDLLQQNIKLEAAKSALEGARSRLLTALEKIQGERENLKKEQEKTQAKLLSTREELEAQKDRAEAATEAARGLLKKIGGLELELARTKGDAKHALATMERNCQGMREAAIKIRHEAGRGAIASEAEKKQLVEEREELRLQIVYMQDSMLATEKRLLDAETELQMYKTASAGASSPMTPASRTDIASKIKSFSSSFSGMDGLTANILPYNGSNRTSTRNSTSGSIDLEDKLKMFIDRNNQLQMENLEFYEQLQSAQETIEVQEKKINDLGEQIKVLEADISISQEALREALIARSQQKNMGQNAQSETGKREAELTQQIIEKEQRFDDATKKLTGRVKELEEQMAAREAEVRVNKQRLGGASSGEVLRVPSSSSSTSSSADVRSDLESLTLKLKESEARLHEADAELKGLRSSSLLHGGTSPSGDTTRDRAHSPHPALGSSGKGPMTPNRTRMPSHVKDSLFLESPRLNRRPPKPGAQPLKLAEAYNIESLPPMDHPWEAVRGALCLYDYEAVEVDELSFSHGQRVVILGLAQPDWYLVDDGAKIGIAPANYVVLDAPAK